MTPTDALVVFTPSGRRGRFEHGTTVLEAARRLGVDLDSVCGGRGICGRCQVEVADGEHAKHGIASSQASDSGRRAGGALRRRTRPRRGRRLGCTACVVGDLVVDVPPESQLYRQVVRKPTHPIELDPVVRLRYVEAGGRRARRVGRRSPATEGRARLEWDLPALGVDFHVLAELQPALRDGDGAVTLPSMTRARSPRSGRGCTTSPSASPSTSARRPSPVISAISPARCSRRQAR